MTRDDVEDTIVLYHQIIHLLAQLDMVETGALQALKIRLGQAAKQHEGMDQHALTIIAGLIALYIEESMS